MQSGPDALSASAEAEVASGREVAMSLRAWIWVLLPWLCLMPGAWAWLPGEPALAVLVERLLILTAPLCLASPHRGTSPGAFLAAWVMAAPAVAAARGIEGTLEGLPAALVLLVAWMLAVSSFRSQGELAVSRLRLAAACALAVPLLGQLFAPPEALELERFSPWSTAGGLGRLHARWPALCTCAVLCGVRAWDERPRRRGARS